MKKVIVVYDSKYGNTEKIAWALSEGLKREGVAVDHVKVQEVEIEKMDQYDLLAVGGPTHAFGMSGPMKDFMKKLKELNIQGKKAFAFDTKFKRRFSGSAAAKIESKLEELQAEIVRPYSSAIVKKTKGPLLEGEEERFRQLGSEIARQILSSTK